MTQLSKFKEELTTVWKEFILQGRTKDNKEAKELLRAEILHSWYRCLDYNVNPFAKANTTILNQADYNYKLEKNSELLDICDPTMQGIYKLVAGSGFAVIMADREGYVLKVLGDPIAVSRAKFANLCEGAKWDERSAGTGAIGLVLTIDKPIQVNAAEHYCRFSHLSTCSAAPIHDPFTGEIIGALNMTGSLERVHPHTLGIVVAAVDSIEKQLALRRSWQNAQMSDKHKSLIMESVPNGVLTIDPEGRLSHLNQKAADLLRLPDKEYILGRTLGEVLRGRESNDYSQLLRIINSGQETTDEVVTLASTFRFKVTARMLKCNEGNSAGMVIILQEISRVKGLVQQMVGTSARTSFKDLVGSEYRFQEAIHFGRTAARTNCNVLLLGESGVGKDVLAQAIHNESPRRSQPFVAINCAAIPRDLLGSELFGYAEGAFTGAKKGGNAGKFELADGGTLFLDEIGEMPLDMQTSLLRILEERAVVRIGGREVITVDVRIIAATNKDLQLEVNRGNFRIDLFYRLNVMAVKLPPLRQRKLDIPILAERLMQTISNRLGKRIESIDHDVLDVFLNYEWPGNIRELQNVIERSVHLATESSISLQLLPPEMRSLGVHSKDQSDTSLVLKSMEEATILSYMNKFRGNCTLVANKLGISRSTLYRKLKKYRISYADEN